MTWANRKLCGADLPHCSFQAHISELRQKVGPVEPVGAEAALYTDEDKVFYVKRMWAEGLTPTAASRLWGVPSRRTLAAWEKEALGGGLAVEAPRVPGACKRAKHARYPEVYLIRFSLHE